MSDGSDSVDSNTLMSVAEVAQMLNVTDSRVRQLLLAGQLSGQRVGRDWVVLRADVVAFMSRPRRRGRPSTSV